MQKKKEGKKGGINFKKLMQNNWAVSAIVLSILLVVSLIFNVVANGVGEKKAGQIVLDFAEEQGVAAELVEVSRSSGLYEVTLNIDGQVVPVYLTVDGKNLVQGVIPLSSTAPSQPSEPTPTNVPKSDKPVVELYVMTHCPYGTQAEKGFLPAIAALGDTVDASIKFVHYFLHQPEYIETPVQICIREEQNDKYAEYLTCFLEDGDTDGCISEVGIDQVALSDCTENRYEDYYAEDSASSESYGVRGSPTLVINGVQASTGRSEVAMLATICSAFNVAPEECNQELSSVTPNPGFGWETSGSASTAATAQC